MENEKGLSAKQVAYGLATTHYGLGFLVGTGQEVLQYGASGLLYAFSTALGLLSLIFISKFYWKKREPIWTLFSNKHGVLSGKITAFLSSFWMLGVVGSQILGGTVALMAFGVPRIFATITISVTILILSYVNLGKLSKIFFYFLIISSIIVVSSLFKYGIGNLFVTPGLFLNSLPSLPMQKTLGIVITTVLITFLGMDFHQFIVEAKSSKKAIEGSLLGFFILACLSTVLGAAILGYISFTTNHEFNSVLGAAQIVPKMLMSTGSSIFGEWSRIFFLLPIILVSAGSGSVVTKVVVGATKEMIPKYSKSRLINAVVIITCIILTMLSSSVVNLVVSFYAMYVGAVLIPFVIVLLEDKRLIRINSYIFNNSIIFGFIFSFASFIFIKINSMFEGEESLFVLLAGIVGAIIVIFSMTTSKIIISRSNILYKNYK